MGCIYVIENGGFRGLEKTKYFLGCFGFFKKIKILKKRDYVIRSGCCLEYSVGIGSNLFIGKFHISARVTKPFVGSTFPLGQKVANLKYASGSFCPTNHTSFKSS